ncbi:hypothetical protein THOE12_20139 [Vibrio rotiferianus]|nr:hypothetical protein THOE12_20139 [Vibrio rotiferianus]
MSLHLFPFDSLLVIKMLNILFRDVLMSELTPRPKIKHFNIDTKISLNQKRQVPSLPIT